MSDQHQASGATAAYRQSAAGVAPPEPQSASVHGSSSASGEGAATRPDAASVEEHLTGKQATARSTASRPSPASTAERGDGGSGSGEERVTGARSHRGIRAWASRSSVGTAATVSSEGRADEAGTAAATATGAGAKLPERYAGLPGRPTKPVLAGAAMAGAILIAVPLLVMATGKESDGDSKKVASSGSADTLLNDDGSKAGEFVAQSPSPHEPEDEKKETPSGKGPDPTTAGPGPSTKDDEADQQGNQKKRGKGEAKAKQERRKRRDHPRTRAAHAARSGGLPMVMTRTLIKNNTNKTCVDIPGRTSGSPGGPIIQSPCNNSTSDNQLWNVKKKRKSGGPGGTPLFVIRNVKAGKCLDLPGHEAVKKGGMVREARCNGTTRDNQLWWLDKRPDGRFWIRNVAANNMCLDSFGPKSDKRGLLVWPCVPEKLNNHEWYLTRT